MADKAKVALIISDTSAHLGAYFPALASCEDIGEVILSDEGQKHVEEARKKLGDKLTHVFNSPEELFQKEKPDLALITLEAGKAPAAINIALDHGCPVFAEKPACTNIEAFEALVQKADSKHLNLMLALANRNNPEVKAARRMIRKGTFGKIYGIELNFIADQTRLTSKSYQSGWFAQKARAGGGHLIWLGIHWLDLGMYITDSKITDVSGFITNIGGQPLDVEDSAALSLKFDKGFLGTMTSGYYVNRGKQSLIKIWGSKGWLEMDYSTGKYLQWSLNSDKPGTIHKFEESIQPRGYSPCVHAAVRSVLDKEPPTLDSHDSLQVLRTIYAAYKAAETGETQHIRID
ncbi:Gfo/Idh/MocA family protein [Gimesia sp.]|uniref:Gfo/Idh/MocA family protein n=1 Tax=Gimesia sp. TaxID=2024833 RepID=UPI003A93BAF2